VPPFASASVIVIVISPLQGGSSVFERNGPNDPLVRHELDEAAVGRVRLRTCLPGSSWPLLSQRDSKRATLVDIATLLCDAGERDLLPLSVLGRVGQQERSLYA
jgi:hypothetical protein